MGQMFYFHKRGLLTALLALVFIASLFSVNWGPDLIHNGGITTMVQLAEGMVKPALSSEILMLGLAASWKTLAYAATGMTLALVLGLVFGVLASGVLFRKGRLRRAAKTIFRGLLGFMRAIHELVWAWLFVAAIGLSPLAAVFAIGIPYGGILGRIFADMLNDVPDEPVNSLKMSGASSLQRLLYGYFPLAAPDMVSYAFYRFECAVRSSAIMSFIGLGGLGFQIELSLHDLKYDEVWTFLYFLIALVILVDAWSRLVRGRLALW
ncbi:PhnE/PtxC family ABC transporter permease [Bacillus marinisedimentorum]|uniref:PhnE/PtxC family ABC transporter permease n=1 Tax=Bacillus marinisedimentorum TaxID=1821260 RepID=UPI0009F1A3E2|nr:ABC transporter permease subunit [Bacillus marinisedimentorum]